VGTSANIYTHTDYYPFGQPARSDGSNYRYAYQGAYAESDANTRLDNFNLRMYDSRIGRWLTTDPAGQYASPYEGMGNNPVMGSDPTGAADTTFEDDGANKITTRVSNTPENVTVFGSWINNSTFRINFNKTPEHAPNPNYDSEAPETGPYFDNNAFAASIGAKGLYQFAKAGEFTTGLIGGGVAAGIESAVSMLVEDVGTEATVEAAPVFENAAEEVGSNVIKNKAAGDAFRDEIANLLEKEGRDVEIEVYKKTPFGKRFIDIDVWHNGENLGGIETKLGSSRYTPLQRLKDIYLEVHQGYKIQVVRGP